MSTILQYIFKKSSPLSDPTPAFHKAKAKKEKKKERKVLICVVKGLFFSTMEIFAKKKLLNTSTAFFTE